MEIEVIIFYLLLIDAIFANVTAWMGKRWYMETMGPFAGLFPMAKGWTFYYLVLVLWIGWLLMRAGTI